MRRGRQKRMAIAGVLLAVVTACSGGGGDDDSADVPVATSTTTTAPVLVGSGSGDPAGSSADDSGVAEAIEPLDFSLPLTGEPATSVGDAYRPALAVKVDNGAGARPQAGVNEADLVFEELVEGGLTRWLAVYHSELPDLIGPVRSARSTDVPILRTLGRPLFAWTGANSTFAATVRGVGTVDVGLDALPDRYTALADRTAPSHLFVDPVELFVDVAGQGTVPPSWLSYVEVGPEFIEPRAIGGVAIDFGSTAVTFEWDQAVQRWVRTQDDTAHVGRDGSVLSATNVIVQFVDYVDTGLTDSNGQSVPEAVLDGSGAAWFLSGGQVVEGRWEDDGFDAVPRYSASSIIYGFRPGSTWIVLAPVGSADLIE